jgi:hypothetical protein
LGADHFQQILRQRDRDALRRLLCKHVFNNADSETKSKIKYALIERALANTTDASPVLARKLFDDLTQLPCGYGARTPAHSIRVNDPGSVTMQLLKGRMVIVKRSKASDGTSQEEKANRDPSARKAMGKA